MNPLRPIPLTALVACLACLWAPLRSHADWVDVETYFPSGWHENQTDLRPYIQQAFDAHARVLFPGGTDPGNPVLYHTTSGLQVQPHGEIRFEGEHRLVRLPSEGRLITLGDHARLTGAVIHGNKYAHWPEFPDMGKSNGLAIRLSNYGEVTDTVVYNNPGTAFDSWGNFNRLRRCRAENVGYNDVRWGEMFYRGAYDAWSGDGFYFRGTGNLVEDCVAYDAFRWGYVASHSGSRKNTFVDCLGGDTTIRSYGFVDFEDAEERNRFIRSRSPNNRIALPASPQVEVIDSMASNIVLYGRTDTDHPRQSYAPVIDGNITTRGGIVLGGWSSIRGERRPGAYNPVVTNNRMFKSGTPSTGDGAHSWSDWSFSVYADDGRGIVANNTLFEYDDGTNRGPGMNLENVQGENNRVVYGLWSLDLPEPELQYGYFP